MEKQEIFDRLKARFKSHSAAARYIGISPRHYRRIRNGGFNHKYEAPVMKYIETVAKRSRPVV